MFLNHYHWMMFALQEAEKAEKYDEVPIGAIIVDNNNHIISKAHNLTHHIPDATAHAEILAIRRACSILKLVRLNYCRLYVTLEPCAMCASAIVQARLQQVIFAAYDTKMGAVEHNMCIFDALNNNHTPEVIAGIAENDAKKILKRFFATKR